MTTRHATFFFVAANREMYWNERQINNNIFQQYKVVKVDNDNSKKEQKAVSTSCVQKKTDFLFEFGNESTFLFLQMKVQYKPLHNEWIYLSLRSFER